MNSWCWSKIVETLKHILSWWNPFSFIALNHSLEPINDALKNLKSLSIRVVASWIKLLVIMHADKIGAKKGKHPFLIKPWVLIWASCFLKFIEGHLITYHKRYTKDQILKLTKRTTENANLTMDQFLFSKYKTIEGLYFLHDVC
jgi:hypothetical protein